MRCIVCAFGKARWVGNKPDVVHCIHHKRNKPYNLGPVEHLTMEQSRPFSCPIVLEDKAQAKRRSNAR